MSKISIFGTTRVMNRKNKMYTNIHSTVDTKINIKRICAHKSTYKLQSIPKQNMLKSVTYAAKHFKLSFSIKFDIQLLKKKQEIHQLVIVKNSGNLSVSYRGKTHTICQLIS